MFTFLGVGGRPHWALAADVLIDRCEVVVGSEVFHSRTSKRAVLHILLLQFSAETL